MFKNLKNQMEKVPSWQYKNNLITSLICWIVFLALFIPFAIYCFSLKLWYLGFIPLFMIVLTSLIWGLGIKWLWKRYKTAVSREQQEQNRKCSLQEENEALKREIEELKRK